MGSIRGDAKIQQISTEIASISAIVGKIIEQAHASGHGDLIARLSSCKDRLHEASERGQDMANIGVSTADREWRMWSQTLPPIAFEIAREAKDLIQRLDRSAMANGQDDFS